MSTTIASVVSSAATALTSSATAAASAPPQAGVLEGASPVAYSASSPITLFVIQATIVIVFCQLLHYPLRLMNQPRVIAEVIVGIILGPSVFMRIPGFKNAIFPQDSMPVFNNVANLGLIIFLFLVALEVDIRLFTHNWKVALSVGLAGMIIPFGLGCAIAWGIFNQFKDEPGTKPISFGVFALFIGTALAITAFPVLCRILTELKLLRSNVGVTVLAAGVGNDVTGWILLALCVALVNNSSGLAALWALLCTIGWCLLLVFVVRPPFIWILKRTGSLQNGPTQGMVALTLLLVLMSSWFTGIIGVHPIFGAFLVGLICPHDGGFAIKLTEKVEDLISVLFLPLYFALSGLSTNLGLLNDGITWAYVIAIIVVAFAGKIIGGTLAARANKLLWRESFTIGVFMSCKGLVELIVLNIGFNANILSQKTFTMFVVMALITTFATTPAVKLLYPPWYQQKVERWRRGEINWDGTPTESSGAQDEVSVEKLNAGQIRKLMVYLRLDSLPSLFTFITLLGAEGQVVVSQPASENGESAEEKEPATSFRRRPLEVYGMRLLELTERTSSVMQVTEGEEFYSLHDPVVNAFRTFSQLNDVAVAGRVAVVPTSSYAETLLTQASEVSSDFALIPWSEYGSVTEDQVIPYDMSADERFRSGSHLDFIQQALQQASKTCNSGIFINNGFGGVTKPGDRPSLFRSKSGISIRSHHEATTLPVANKTHHVLMPFFGGADDRVALRFVLQLAKNPLVTATIAHFAFPADGEEDQEAGRAPEVTGTAGKTTATVRSGGKAIEDVTATDLALLATLRSSLPAELAGRVTFTEVDVTSATNAVAETLALAKKHLGRTKNAGDVVVVGRRHRRLGDGPGMDAAAGSMSTGYDLAKTIGVIAEQAISGAVKASILVIQAGGRGLDTERWA